MWQDYYLKFETQAAYDTLMEEPGVIEAMAQQPSVVDVVGVIHHGDTGMDTAGYHVNMRLSGGYALPEGLQPWVIERPVQPKRVFMAD